MGAVQFKKVGNSRDRDRMALDFKNKTLKEYVDGLA